ncbi:MAG: ATP-binding protein [Clostridia bacterium]|nr:ATP-binding protein [Clostridia bacterium]
MDNKHLIIRKSYLEKLWRFKDKQMIKVVTGIRRCGKSTLLRQYQDMLMEHGAGEDQIVYLNFEDLDNEELRDYHNLYAYLKSKLLSGRCVYIFLDEIQNVPSFETVVDSLYIKDNVDLYITGSNSYLLSGELATKLSGRYFEINLLPLSFSEYKELMGGDDNGKLFNEYAVYGGMPYAAVARKEGWGDQYTYIEGIYNTVFVKDIEERQKRLEPNPSGRKVTDIPLLRMISTYLSSVVGSLVSMSGIAGYLTSTGRKISPTTVSAYVDALTTAYLYYPVCRFDVGGKKLLESNQKYYIVDMGFQYYALARKSYQFGFTIENIVYFELVRRGYRVNVGKLGGLEVDFVAYKDRTYEYYQVTATLHDEDTFKREITPLESIKDNYSKILLTYDTDELTLGDCNGVKIVNVIDWLLDTE